jgi:predicted nucleotidyltransferase
METTHNKISPYAKKFFDRLSQYLDTKLYFYGSVQRGDYFPNSSDIDVDIFTDNESSTILQMQNFLKVPPTEFKRIVYRLHRTNELVSGYKIKYKSQKNNFEVEFSIYNERFKKQVLEEHRFKTVLPWHVAWLLYILKFVYYKLFILPKSTYIFLKNLTLDHLVEGEASEFVVID